MGTSVRIALLTVVLFAWTGGPDAEAASVLHMGFGGPESICPIGCGMHPNRTPGYPTDFLHIYFNSNKKNYGAIDPLLLIIGVPKEAGFFNPADSVALNSSPSTFYSDTKPIKDLKSYNPYPTNQPVWPYPTNPAPQQGTWHYGVKNTAGSNFQFPNKPMPNGSAGYQGLFASGDVYGFLGLGDQTNNSNNFTNWQAAALQYAGIQATGFHMYVFSLHAAFNAHGLLSIQVNDTVGIRDSIPQGSFVMAYGHDHTAKPLSSPFTETVLQHSDQWIVAEPASILLMGTGLLAVGRMCRRRRPARGHVDGPDPLV